jgi:hypothetical protein
MDSIPPEFSACDHQHLNHIVWTVHAAIRNQGMFCQTTGYLHSISTVILPSFFNAERFAALAARLPSHNGTTPSEDTLRKVFPCLELGTLTGPGTVVDKDGNILVWSLPNILPESLVVCDHCCCVYSI